MRGISKCGAWEYEYGNRITEKKVTKHRQFFKVNQKQFLDKRFEKWMEREEVKRSNLLHIIHSKLKGIEQVKEAKEV